MLYSKAPSCRSYMFSYHSPAGALDDARTTSGRFDEAERATAHDFLRLKRAGFAPPPAWFLPGPIRIRGG